MLVKQCYRRDDKNNAQRDWRLFPREGLFAMMQVPIYNDCRVRATGHAEWLGIWDIDEFPHPMSKFRTVPEVLAAKEKIYPDLKTVRMCDRSWWGTNINGEVAGELRLTKKVAS